MSCLASISKNSGSIPARAGIALRASHYEDIFRVLPNVIGGLHFVADLTPYSQVLHDYQSEDMPGEH